MALMPKRVKHRKSQRGRIRGNATRGNRVVFGEYGLQSEQGGWLSAATIEAGLKGGGGEIAVGEGSVWVTLFKFPITRIEARRMSGTFSRIRSKMMIVSYIE